MAYWVMNSYINTSLVMHKDHEDKPFTLEVDKRCHECNVGVGELEKLYHKGLELLKQQQHLKEKLHGGVVKVFFVSDEEIQQLNRNYRDLDKPTDVISLSYFEESPFPGEDLVGEIFISVDTAHKQAQEHNVSVKEEAQFLFVHGFLHIFGYDHQEKAERKVMFDLQDEIIGHSKWRPLIDHD